MINFDLLSTTREHVVATLSKLPIKTLREYGYNGRSKGEIIEKLLNNLDQGAFTTMWLSYNTDMVNNRDIFHPVVVTTNCYICTTILDTNVVSIGCGHMYHRTCIETWFATSTKCPVCRT